MVSKSVFATLLSCKLIEDYVVTKVIISLVSRSFVSRKDLQIL